MAGPRTLILSVSGEFRPDAEPGIDFWRVDFLISQLINLTGDNMSRTPAARQRHILELLDARQILTIQELVTELGVSAMTVHRDLNKLARQRPAREDARRRRPALRSAARQAAHPLLARCATGPFRSAARSSCRARSCGRLTACCPHCGLALLEQQHLRRSDAGHRLPVLPDGQRERRDLPGGQRCLVVLPAGDPRVCRPRRCRAVPARVWRGDHESRAGAALLALQDVCFRGARILFAVPVMERTIIIIVRRKGMRRYLILSLLLCVAAAAMSGCAAEERPAGSNVVSICLRGRRRLRGLHDAHQLPAAGGHAGRRQDRCGRPRGAAHGGEGRRRAA